MTSEFHAIVSWISPGKGGRQLPPTGLRYSTLVHFEDDDHWPDQVWSLMLDFQRSLHDGRYTVATIRFLSEAAPTHLLREGNRFELLEGRKRVAKGIVVPENVDIPAELNSFETALIG